MSETMTVRAKVKVTWRDEAEADQWDGPQFVYDEVMAGVEGAVSQIDESELVTEVEWSVD